MEMRHLCFFMIGVGIGALLPVLSVILIGGGCTFYDFLKLKAKKWK